MRLDEFDYDLDKELIAQTPLEKEMVQDLWC